MVRQTSKGNCVLCGKSFSKSGISRHLQSCREKSAMGGRSRGFHLAIEGRDLPEYWLHLDVAADAPLAALDRYLRETWLECCGHLSAFYFGGRKRSSRSRDKLGRILSLGMQFTHEYDFGDTTELSLRVVWEGDVNVDAGAIRLLARNDPPALTCVGCGAAAAQICAGCAWKGEGLFCGECVGPHIAMQERGENMLLPVVNSPRMGMCGYTGPESEE